MSPELEFILRSQAAVQGSDLPPAIKRRFERGFDSLLLRPGASLDKALGITPGRGQDCIAEQYKRYRRDAYFVSHYRKHLASKSPNAASQDQVNNLELLASDYDDPHIPDHYRKLFDRLESTGTASPSQRTIYELLRNS